MGRRTTQRGSLLIITLSLVAILSLLAVAIGRQLSLEVRLARYRRAHEQARAFARSGVYLAMQRLAQDRADDAEHADWLGDDWAVVPGEGAEPSATWVIPVPGDDPAAPPVAEIRVTITDEDRKFNVNAVADSAPAVLATLVTPPELAQALVDHVDADEAGELAQDDPPYRPKNAHLVALEELLPVPGMSEPVLTDTLQPLFTVWTEDTALALNVNTALAESLTALAEGDAGILGAANDLHRSRSGLDGTLGTEDDCVVTQDDLDGGVASAKLAGASCAATGDEAPFLALLGKANFRATSSTFRIQAEALSASSNARHRIDAVVRRAPAGAAGPAVPVVVAWREG